MITRLGWFAINDFVKIRVKDDARLRIRQRPPVPRLRREVS
jgi:hypothetical protein